SLVVPLSCSPSFPYTTLFRSFVAIFSGTHCRTSDSRHGRRSDSFRAALKSSGIRRLREPLKFTKPNHGARRESAQFPVCGSQGRSEEHTSELQSRENLVCRLL